MKNPSIKYVFWIKMTLLFCLGTGFIHTRADVIDNVTVNPDVRYQTFEGFGVGTMDQFIPYWYTVWPSSKLVDFLNKMYTLDNDGLGLEICRVPMPVGDAPGHNHMWAYPDQGYRSPESFEIADGVYNWNGHDDILWHIQGAAGRGAKMWAYWHSVPDWMTVSGCTSGHTDGTQNNLQAGKEARFAQHICDVIEHFRDYWNVDFDYVGAINEPDEDWWQANGGQPGCHVSSDQAITIYQALINEMASRVLTQKIVTPDSYSCANDHNLTYLDTMLSSTIGPILDVLSCHQYYVAADGPGLWEWRARRDGKSFWMSEWGDWENDGWPDNNPYLQAMNYATKIQQGLKDMRVNAYIFWEQDFFLDTTTSGFSLRKSYWAAAQFSRFIRSGMQLLDTIDTHTDCKTTVWIDPVDDSAGQKLAIVTVNNGLQSATVNYDLAGFHGVQINEVRRTSQTENYANLSFAQSSAFDFSVTAPAGSVVTVSATAYRCEDMGGELTGDCIVDLDDLIQVAQNWLRSQSTPCPPMPGNTNDDCDIDMHDVGVVSEQWLGIKAFNPNPADDEASVNPQRRLSWGDNYHAISYDVYIGTDAVAVANATSASPEYMGNQTDTFYPVNLSPNQTYYWRIDTEDAPGQFQTGDAWSFTTTNVAVPEGLVGWWKLDEANGSTAADASGFGDYGTTHGNPQWKPTQGILGGAIDLDGNGDYISISGFNLTTNNVTFTAWINGVKATDWAGIVYSRSSQATGIHFGGGTELHYTWNYNDASTWNWGGGPVIPENVWALVAMTVESDKITLYVYSDGTGLQSAVNMTSHVPQTIDALEIGRDSVVSTRCFNGLVDDVRIYNRALTEQEIMDLVP